MILARIPRPYLPLAVSVVMRQGHGARRIG